jgi:peptidyl-prolyl cis-trans isomerase B (cyclophilin B)
MASLLIWSVATDAPSLGTGDAGTAQRSAALSDGALEGPPGPPTCSYPTTTEPAARAVPLPPTSGVETSKVYVATIVTGLGDITFQVDSAVAPCTANNFRSLAHFRFFDRTRCHRLTTVALRVLQCGDPTGTGSGGPGYRFDDERQRNVSYPRGTVAMASAGKDTNGSQFFIVYGDSTLPEHFTVFGRVTAGLPVLDAVAQAGSDGSYGLGDGRPKATVEIATVRVRPAVRSPSAGE